MISCVFQSNGIANLLFNHCITAPNRCEGLFDYIFNFLGVTVQKCMWSAATKNAKTFQLVLNTLTALGSVLDFEKGGEMDDTRSLSLRLLELVTFYILHSLLYLILIIRPCP